MQQINLYTHLPHPVKSLVDARALLVLFGVFCLTLLLSFSAGLLQKYHDYAKLAQAAKQFQTAKDYLTVLALKNPSVIMQAPDIAKLAYCKFKFSALLEAFAEAIVPGVWLTDISITGRGQSLSVKGHALVEGQVQLYAEQLNHLEIFKQTPLVLQDVTRGSADDKKSSVNMLNFRISTKAAQDNG
jgi:hypothetical protein